MPAASAARRAHPHFAVTWVSALAAVASAGSTMTPDPTGSASQTGVGDRGRDEVRVPGRRVAGAV
ncbi:hypothetical protein, partial [Microbacterium aurum]